MNLEIWRMHHSPSISIGPRVSGSPKPHPTGVTLATTREQMESLRPIWKALAPRDIDSDIDFFSTVVANAALVLNPTVMHLRSPEGRDLMAISRREILHIPFRFGYAKLGKAVVRAVVVTFDGILGAENPADEAVLMKELYGLLKRGEADFILMRNVQAEGTLFREATEAAGSAIRVLARPPSMRWVADIPSSLEDFLQRRSGKTRSTLRRKARQLEQEFANVRIRRFCRPEELGKMCADMESVAAASYQRRLGVGFDGAPMQVALIKRGLEMSRYSTWMLYLDGRPVAFWNGFAYRDTFFIGTPAFDHEYGKHSVGSYAMMHMIEDLCADPAITRLDFGHGEAEYKSAFGHADRLERDIYLAAARPFPVMLLAAVRANMLLENWIRQTAGKLEFTRRLKARWRKGAFAGS